MDRATRHGGPAEPRRPAPGSEAATTPLRRLAARATARIALSRWVMLLGPALAAGWLVGGALVAADRLIGLGLAAPAWLMLGAPVLVAGLTASGAALARTPRSLASLQAVDESLDLKNALATGAELAPEAQRDPFAALALRRAVDSARSARLGRLAPIRLDAWWAMWPAIALAAIAAALWTPDVAAQRAARLVERQSQRLVQTEEAQRDVASALAVAQEALADQAQAQDRPPSLPREAQADELARLAQLERELAQGSVDPDAARTRAAHSLERLAQAAEEQAQESAAAQDALAQRFQGLKPAQAEDGQDDDALASAVEQLREALAQGDAARAAEALDALEKDLAKADEEARQRLAEDLGRLADEIERPSAPDASQGDADPQAPLNDAGLTEEEAADLLRDAPTREALRNALEERGFDPATADRIAEEAHQRRQAERAREQAERTADELSRSLKRAADQTRKQPQPPDSSDQAPQQGQQDPQGPQQREDQQGQGEGQRDPAQERAPTQGEPSPGAPTPGAQSEQPGGPAQEEQPSSTEKPPGESGQSEQPAKGSEPGERGAPGEQGAQREQRQPEQSPSGQSPQTAPGQSEPQPSPAPTPGAAPPDGSTPQSPGDPPQLPERMPRAEELERARKLLEEMGNQREQSEQQRKQAQRLREQAQRMLENMSPEERERLERWADSLAREQGQQPEGAPQDDGASGAGGNRRTLEQAPTLPGEFARQDIVDLRRRERETAGEGQTVGELLRERDADQDGESARALSRAIDQASKSAQRAMEERTIPARRRDAVRRYFDRLRELASEKHNQPAPDAPDAGKPGSKPPDGGAGGDGGDGGGR